MQGSFQRRQLVRRGGPGDSGCVLAVSAGDFITTGESPQGDGATSAKQDIAYCPKNQCFQTTVGRCTVLMWEGVDRKTNQQIF